MGQIESKIFEEAPPWDINQILSLTDLDRTSINLCWRFWATDPLTKKGKIKPENFFKVLNIDLDYEDEVNDAKRIFGLIDKDKDGKIDFPEMMIFLFTIDENPSKEQKLRRSFQFYDKNCSGKITKEEMVVTLNELGKVKAEFDEKGDVIVPNDVENLFSLMDFAHDQKISQMEFIRATSHYRRLGQLLTIDLLENRRLEIVRKVKTTDWKKMPKKGSVRAADSIDGDDKTSSGSQSNDESDNKVTETSQTAPFDASGFRESVEVNEKSEVFPCELIHNEVVETVLHPEAIEKSN